MKVNPLFGLGILSALVSTMGPIEKREPLSKAKPYSGPPPTVDYSHYSVKGLRLLKKRKARNRK